MRNFCVISAQFLRNYSDHCCPRTAAALVCRAVILFPRPEAPLPFRQEGTNGAGAGAPGRRRADAPTHQGANAPGHPALTTAVGPLCTPPPSARPRSHRVRVVVVAAAGEVAAEGGAGVDSGADGGGGGDSGADGGGGGKAQSPDV